MKIAYILSNERGSTSTFFGELVSALQSKGVKVVGTIQTATAREKSHKCDMDIRVLPDGDIIRISQNLGPPSSGCHMDASALEEAVAQTAIRLEHADILILNKFGKQEAQGRGFRSVIASAVLSDIPIVVGVNALNIAAFLEFCGGDAVELEATPSAVSEWAISILQ